MDGSHLDALAKALTADHSRRSLTRLLRTLFLSGPLVLGRVAETTAKKGRKKKRGRKKRNHFTTPQGDCPSDQKACDGTCIARSACCDNGDCQISGQLCDRATQQCRCPESLRDICGGACWKPCDPFFAHKPAPDCGCCGVALAPSGADPTTCCSRRHVQFGDLWFCTGFAPGEVCDFPEQCDPVNCVDGRCTGCAVGEDYCTNFSARCVNGTGQCLTSVDGTTRCGIGETANEGDCGWCRHNDDCDQQGQRPGAFCAVNTGSGCGCARGQTFCARPVPAQ